MEPDTDAVCLIRESLRCATPPGAFLFRIYRRKSVPAGLLYVRSAEAIATCTWSLTSLPICSAVSRCWLGDEPGLPVMLTVTDGAITCG